MARAALFLTDLWGAANVANNSGFNLALPVGNVSTPLPGEVAEQMEGQFLNGDGGMFEVGLKTGRYVFVNEGAADIQVTVPPGTYTANGLATAITDACNISVATASSYTVTYNTSTRKYLVQIAPAGYLANATADNVLTSQCGFAASDTGVGVAHLADSARSSTITRVIFNAGSGSVIDPDFAWCLLNSAGGADTAASAMYNDCTVYANATYLGDKWAAWDAGASETFAVSDRPSETENTIQGAVVSTDTGYQYWAFFWHHVDDHTSHQIGVLRAAAALTSSTYTVREVTDHQLLNRTAPRTMENQHPVALLSDWRMAVEFERWPSASYRALKVEADRYGGADGMAFSLRWSDIVAATLTVNGEADKGFIFYGSILESSSDSYGGNESDYMTGSLRLGQLRGPGAT